MVAKIDIPKALVYIRRNLFKTELKCQRSLDVADPDWRSDSKARIEGLDKFGLKPVQEGHGVAYAVKCQHPCSVIQVHAYPRGVRTIGRLVHAVVPRWVTGVRTKQTPGFVVIAQQTERTFALSTDAPIGHSDGELPVPLDLPVEAASR